MEFTRAPAAHFIVVGIILVLSIISFGFNGLRVVGSEHYANLQIDSQQTVLDGILHNEVTGNPATFGLYTRPSLSIKQNRTGQYRLLQQRNTEGEFAPYQSQLGAHVPILADLRNRFGIPVDRLELANAVLLSIIVAGLYAGLSREFGLIAGAAFCLALILSPWIVGFARNLYWMEWTWFLPMLVAVLVGKAAFRNGRGAIAVLLVLGFLAFLLRFLSAYDYFLPIVLAALAPLVYFAIKERPGIKRGLGVLFGFGICSVIAFVLVLFVHAYQISGRIGAGLQEIQAAATKRMYSREPAKVAAEVCASAPQREACEADYLASLNAPVMTVVAAYFAHRKFLPWINSYEADLINSEAEGSRTRALLLEGIRTASFERVVAALRQARPAEIATLVAVAVQAAAFLTLIGLLGILLVRDLPASLPYAGLLVTAFLAPISWYVVFKGHSYIHFHLNYVLWNIAFVPFAILYLVARRTAPEAR